MTSISELYKIYLEYPNVQTDTRQLSEGCIFFALRGDNFNGNDYALQALEQGAAYAVIDDSVLAENNERLLLVEDVLETLQQLSQHHRKQFDFPFLAITGSNGKTTTKELLAAVLGKKYNVLATKGNFNNHIGVPLTLLSVTKENNFAIIEMGANHQKEIEAYCQWALPDFGLINNCGKAHLEGFGGIEGVRKGKGELYDFIRANGGTIFRNADYDYLKEMSSGIKDQITYGEYQGDLRGKIYEREPYLSIALITKGKEQIVHTQLVGDYNLPNVLAALSVGNHFGVSFDDMEQAIADYHPSNNRSEHKVINGVNVILDAYNANPTSMKAAIDSFSKNQSKDKTIVLGAMMELGEESKIEHENIVNYARQFAWKNIVTVGEFFKESAEAHGVIYFEDATQTKEWFWKNVSAGEWAYLKGSRLTAMEKIIKD